MDDRAEKGKAAKKPDKDKAKKDEHAAEKKKATPKPEMLKRGQTIGAQSGSQYVVERLLGRGGFGEVYKVALYSDPAKKFAMKVETARVTKKSLQCMLRLKVELHVYDTIAAAPDSSCDKSHFVKMHDKGKTRNFKYYVMDEIWMSLEDLVKKVLDSKISPDTMVKIARQTLKGIEVLHQLGFLHRDIKTANYAIGLPPYETTIFILDFGISRPFRDENGKARVPRARVAFLGTHRYASIRSMEKQEQSQKDDLEVWIYMMLELYHKNNLFWRGYDPKDDKFWAMTLKAKIDLAHSARPMFFVGELKIPEQYVDIIEHVAKMKYGAEGDFAYINTLLSDIVIKWNLKDNNLDWVGKLPPLAEPEKVEPTKDVIKEDEKAPKDENKKNRKSDKKKERKMGSALTKNTQNTVDLSILTMEEIKEELIRQKRRKSKSRQRENEDRRDDDDEDSQQDDYSDSEEESRIRRRRRNRKKKDYSDRTDNRDERDERRRRGRTPSPGRRMASKSQYDETQDDDRRRRRGRSPEGKKKNRVSKKKRGEESEMGIAKIPEPKETVEDKDKDRKKTKEEKTIDVKEKTVDVDQKKKSGKTLEKSPAAKSEPVKKADDAAPAKK